jgi:hypothetical protein
MTFAGWALRHPPSLEFAIHHVSVRVTQLWVQECFRKLTYYIEAMLLPEADCAIINTDNEVELHRPEVSLARTFKRMSTHRTSHSTPCRRWRGHVSAIRHMGTSTPLVCSQEVGAENPTIIFRNKDFVFLGKPIVKCTFSAQVSRQSVGVTCPNYGFEDRPDGITIAGLSGANGQHALMMAERDLRCLG